jgi:hypothetical protein
MRATLLFQRRNRQLRRQAQNSSQITNQMLVSVSAGELIEQKPENDTATERAR